MPLAPDLLLLSRRRKASCVNARHSSDGWNPVLALNFFEVQGFHSPSGRACYFLCLCKESNQRNTPPVARSPGILPSECASGFRGSLSAHPCARSARARFLRAPLRAFPAPARRGREGPGSKRRARQSLPQKRLVLALLPLGPSVTRRRADGQGPRVSAGAREGSRAFRCRAGSPVSGTPAARSAPAL